MSHSQPFSSTADRAEAPAARGSLAVIFLTVMIDLLGFAMVLPLLPVYAKKFGEDDSGMLTGMLMASFSIMQFVFAPLWGRISDRVGRRPVLLIGLAGAAVFYAVFGLATMWHSIAWLFISRIGAGIACATIPVAQAYIADTTTLANRAKGMALIGAAFGVGFCIGPLLGYTAIMFSPNTETSPMPGFTAAGLSAFAFVLALARLPESLTANSQSAARKLFDGGAWKDAFSTPSVAALLLASFVSVLSFGGFETTLALLLKDKSELKQDAIENEQSDRAASVASTTSNQIAAQRDNRSRSLFHFTDRGVLLFFSFIGLVLSLTQGVLVRRLSGKVSEGRMASCGAIFSVLGFALMIWAVVQVNLNWLMVACAIEVMGFAFMTPSLQSLVSRRSDPAKQGSIAGVSQSVSSLARIAGPLLAIPLFAQGVILPYIASLGMMLLGLVVLNWAVRGGSDHAAAKPMGSALH